MGIEQASTSCPPYMATSTWETVPTRHRHVRTGQKWGYTTRSFQSKSQFILNKTVNAIQWTEVSPGLFSLGKDMLCLLPALCDVCYGLMPATQSWWVVAAHDQGQPLLPERETVINVESLAVGIGRQSCFYRQNLWVLRDFHSLEGSREKSPSPQHSSREPAMPIVERWVLTGGTLADGGRRESSLNFRTEPRWAACEQKEHHQDQPQTNVYKGKAPAKSLAAAIGIIQEKPIIFSRLPIRKTWPY